jgi:predicted MFS family arabinose efflux permease
METLDNLNSILVILQAHAFTIGLTVAGLMMTIYAILIMLSTDTSPVANRNKWDGLQKVMICACVIAGGGALIQLAKDFGSLLCGSFCK